MLTVHKYKNFSFLFLVQVYWLYYFVLYISVQSVNYFTDIAVKVYIKHELQEHDLQTYLQVSLEISSSPVWLKVLAVHFSCSV